MVKRRVWEGLRDEVKTAGVREEGGMGKMGFVREGPEGVLLKMAITEGGAKVPGRQGNGGAMRGSSGSGAE